MSAYDCCLLIWLRKHELYQFTRNNYKASFMQKNCQITIIRDLKLFCYYFSLVTLSVMIWRIFSSKHFNWWILTLQYIFHFLKIIVKWVMFQVTRKIYFGCIVIVLWNNLFLCSVTQGWRKVWKSGGASSNVVGIICPPWL